MTDYSTDCIKKWLIVTGQGKLGKALNKLCCGEFAHFADNKRKTGVLAQHAHNSHY